MIRRPPRSTRTDTLFPYTTLFRSNASPGSALIAPSRRLTVQDVSLIKHLRGFPAFGQQRLQFDPNASYASSASRTPRQAQRWHTPPVPLPSPTLHPHNFLRSEERRVGTECFSPCSSRCSRSH